MSMERRSKVIEASSVRNPAWAVSVTFSMPASGWSAERLGVEHVEAGVADAAAAQAVQQGRFVDQRGARGVDENHARLHARELRRPRNPRVLVVEREMQRDHVGARQEFVKLDQRFARLAGVRFQAITSMPRPRPDAQDFAADAAEPDDAERLAAKLHAFAASTKCRSGLAGPSARRRGSRPASARSRARRRRCRHSP